MRGWRAACAGAALLAGLCGPVLAQDEATLTPGQVFALADGLAQEGNFAQAVPLAQALLVRDPADIRALLLLANIATAQGDNAAARDYAARAYAATDDRGARFLAARLAANGHAGDRQDTRAQLWLRRAREYAPDSAAAAAVAEDFASLRRRNPLSIDLRFGITPSNNVNNGSASPTAELFGLPFNLNNAAQAQSGVEIFGGIGLGYRLAEDRTSQTNLLFDIDVLRVALSGEAKAAFQSDYDDEVANRLDLCGELGIAPADCALDGIDPPPAGADFGTTDLRFALEHRRILAPGLQPTNLTAELGQSWYGGDAFTRFAGLNLRQGWNLPGDAVFTAQLGYRLTDYFDDPANPDGSAPDADATTSLSLAWAKQLGNGDVVRVNLGRRDNTSETANREYRSRSIGLGYDLQQPVATLQIGGSINFEERIYDVSSYASGGPRFDDTWSLRLNARLTEVEYFGFQPVVTINATRTDSSIDLFDRDTTSLGFDLVSSF